MFGKQSVVLRGLYGGAKDGTWVWWWGRNVGMILGSCDFMHNTRVCHSPLYLNYEVNSCVHANEKRQTKTTKRTSKNT